MSGSNSSSPADAAAEPLTLTVHALPDPAAHSPRRTAVGRWQMLAVLLVCAAPVLASYFTYFVWRPEGRSNYAELIQPGRDLPALSLRQLDGQVVSADSLRGQWLLVVVASGACDRACEDMLFLQRQLREMTGRERERIDKVWLVRDDQPVAPSLVAALGAAPATRVLRVPAAELSAWLAPQPGHELDEHLFIVDPMGLWMMRSPPKPDPSRLKRDIEKLLRASAFWDQPGR